MKKQLLLLLALLAPHLYAMELTELPKPMEIEEGPELKKFQENPLDITLRTMLQAGYYEAASELMNSGMGLSPMVMGILTEPRIGQSILHYALNNGHIHTVNVLMRYELVSHVEPNIWETLFQTLVRNINEKESRNTLLVFLKSKYAQEVDLNKRRDLLDTYSILEIAVNYEMPNIVQVLLDVGADPNLIDAHQESLLVRVAKEKQQSDKMIQIFKLLAGDKNIQINHSNKSKWTAFFWAASENKVEFGKILAAHGADINLQSYNDLTPIMMAFLRENAEFAGWLLNNAQPDLLLGNDNTHVLRFAYRSQNPEIQALVPLLNAKVNEQIEQLEQQEREQNK